MSTYLHISCESQTRGSGTGGGSGRSKAEKPVQSALIGQLDWPHQAPPTSKIPLRETTNLLVIDGSDTKAKLITRARQIL